MLMPPDHVPDLFALFGDVDLFVDANDAREDHVTVEAFDLLAAGYTVLQNAVRLLVVAQHLDAERFQQAVRIATTFTTES